MYKRVSNLLLRHQIDVVVVESIYNKHIKKIRFPEINEISEMCKGNFKQI